ncbi:MAG: 3-dehydroquinate synthase [Clostridia bacterium]|nr:3-dehydroquinate synthase [Clostridia bacterium]
MIVKRFETPESPGYDIIIGDHLLGKTAALLGLFPRSRVLVVTEEGVPTVYPDKVEESFSGTGCSVFRVTLPGGEEHKNLNNISLILESLILYSFNRNDAVISVGGGVTGDTAGFAASIYMRGIDFYNVPTTLLSQADSSVGGKTGVNFGGIKNMIGAFHQPKGVLIDTDTLTTLPERQFSNGMAEIIKMAAAFDARLFDDIGTVSPVGDIVSRALDIKISVVRADEKESGLRRSLNFGHTIGHGIELNSDLFHGEAVGIGMLAMSEHEARQKISEKLSAFGLPLTAKISADDVMNAVMHDKKSSSGGVRCIICDKIGTFREKLLSADEIKERLLSVLR